MILWDLFYTFFKIGLFTIGGGYAMIPLIKTEVIETHAWLTAEEFIDIVAVAEMTPGPIAVNTATFVGYRLSGIPGALLGTLGVVLPSVIIITLIAAYFRQYELQDLPRLKAAFMALRPAVVGLIASAVFSLGKKSVVDVRSITIAALVFAVISFSNIHPIIVLLTVGSLGAIFLG